MWDLATIKRMNKNAGKPYKRIRLEYNEGRCRTPEEDKRRSRWVYCIADLPSIERPNTGDLGYNKHYYEIELKNGDVIKYRVDVHARYSKEDYFTEEELKKAIEERKSSMAKTT